MNTEWKVPVLLCSVVFSAFLIFPGAVLLMASKQSVGFVELREGGRRVLGVIHVGDDWVRVEHGEQVTQYPRSSVNVIKTRQVRNGGQFWLGIILFATPFIILIAGSGVLVKYFKSIKSHQ
jgi:hypothetical protein